MQIVRYRRYPQSDLSAALERLTNMRAEMDRAFESTSSFSGSPAPSLESRGQCLSRERPIHGGRRASWSQEGRDGDLVAQRHAHYCG
jgi:hypothetical protein